jgi:hypothetical protein
VDWRCPSTCALKSPLAFSPQVEGQQIKRGGEARLTAHLSVQADSLDEFRSFLDVIEKLEAVDSNLPPIAGLAIFVFPAVVAHLAFDVHQAAL